MCGGHVGLVCFYMVLVCGRFVCWMCRGLLLGRAFDACLFSPCIFVKHVFVAHEVVLLML